MKLHGRKGKTFQGDLRQVNQETVNMIVSELDPESKAIVNYVWQNKYATIDELATLGDSSNHMHILLKIKEIINPLAERIMGYPLLVFEKSKIDPENGRKILFSWWTIGGEKENLKREKLMDLFNEEDHLRIIMELYGANQENIHLKVNNNKLIVFINSPEKKYREEIPLPFKVNENGLSKIYKNGILEVKLKKLQ
jgi:HSP20 family molecular chaperone IbpA